MKARVKATGEIVEVDLPFISASNEIVYDRVDSIQVYAQDELDFEIQGENIIDYWEKLKHQAAIAAMQGLMSKEILDTQDSLLSHAIHYATALVEKLKNEKI